MKAHWKRGCVVLAVIVSLALGPVSQVRALSVFDGANYSQNLLTAVRTLQMVNNQIKQLANEAQMLVNMARHLQPLDYNASTQIRTALFRIDALMRRAEGLAYEVAEVDAAYARLFPEEYAAAVTTDELVRDARERWELSRQAFQQTMRIQAQVVRNVESDASILDRLVLESQAAVGSLQAQQAGNQLVALNTKQALQTQELLAAQQRAEALEQARAVLSEEQARARFARFIGDGTAYTPIR